MIIVSRFIIDNETGVIGDRPLHVELVGEMIFNTENDVSKFESLIVQLFAFGGFVHLKIKTIISEGDADYNDTVDEIKSDIIEMINSSVKSCPNCFSSDIELVEDTDNLYMCYGCKQTFKV